MALTVILCVLQSTNDPGLVKSTKNQYVVLIYHRLWYINTILFSKLYKMMSHSVWYKLGHCILKDWESSHFGVIVRRRKKKCHAFSYLPTYNRLIVLDTWLNIGTDIAM